MLNRAARNDCDCGTNSGAAGFWQPRFSLGAGPRYSGGPQPSANNRCAQSGPNNHRIVDVRCHDCFGQYCEQCSHWPYLAVHVQRGTICEGCGLRQSRCDDEYFVGHLRIIHYRMHEG